MVLGGGGAFSHERGTWITGEYGHGFSASGGFVGTVQGYLTYKKTHPPRTLP